MLIALSHYTVIRQSVTLVYLALGSCKPLVLFYYYYYYYLCLTTDHEVADSIPGISTNFKYELGLEDNWVAD